MQWFHLVERRPDRIEAPAVVQRMRVARRELKAVGLLVEEATESSPVRRGLVVWMEPEAGTPVTRARPSGPPRRAVASRRRGRSWDEPRSASGTPRATRAPPSARSSTSPTPAPGHGPTVQAAASAHDVGRCTVRPTVRPLRAAAERARRRGRGTGRAVARLGAPPDHRPLWRRSGHPPGCRGRPPPHRRAPPPPAPGFLPIVDRVLAAPTGTRIPAPVRRRVEPHVGVDLGGVRVLTGPRASAAAASVGARAFTAGSTIVLGRGQSPHDSGLMARTRRPHVAQHALDPARAADACTARRSCATSPNLLLSDAGPARHLVGRRHPAVGPGRRPESNTSAKRRQQEATYCFPSGRA